jgi:hypothetical protein
MKRSTMSDRILQQLANAIGVWEKNQKLRMVRYVTIGMAKATRVRLDTCAMDVQATNQTRAKQIDDRDDCGKLSNQYLVRVRKAIQGYFGPDSTQYAQVGGTGESNRKSGGRRAKVGTVL